MAGMDWFRWHHGSITDPKFQLVAKKSGASVAEVVALWAFALEEASMSDDRGSIEGLDIESVECLLGLDDGKGELILAAMAVRGLIADGRIASWDKRQPARERDDDNAAERKRKQRERDAMSHQETPEQEHVTPCHTMSHQKTPREEKIREEKKEGSKAIRAPRFDAQAHLVEIGIPADLSADWIKLRKTKKAEVTKTAIDGIASEAGKAGLSLDDALRECCARGWAGFKAEWMLSPQARAAPAYQSLNDKRAETIAILTGKKSNERTIANERDIAGESRRVAG